MVVDDFYRKDMQTVRKEENLNYKSLERLVFHLVEAGQSPVNDYVNAANQFVQEVLCNPRGADIEQRCKSYWERNQKGAKGNQTILRISISSWVLLFRAFYFAKDYWDEKDCQKNYRDLLTVYFAVEKDDAFSVSRIQQVNSLWQGIPSVDILIILLQHLNGFHIAGNMNEIPDFFVFFERSLKKIFELGFVDDYDYWILDGIAQNKDVQMCLECLGEFSRKLRRTAECFRRHPEIGGNGVIGKYDVIEEYLEQLREIMKAETSLAEEKSGIRSQIVDLTGEAENQLLNISDDREFVQAANINKDNLSYAQLANVLRRRAPKK